MDEKLEIIYYQLLQMENRLDKKIEFIETAEKTLDKAVLVLQDIVKKLEK